MKHFEPVFCFHRHKIRAMVLRVEYDRDLPFPGIPFALRHGIIQIQPFNVFAFDVDSGRTYHIRISVRAGVLLPSSGVIALRLEQSRDV